MDEEDGNVFEDDYIEMHSARTSVYGFMRSLFDEEAYLRAASNTERFEERVSFNLIKKVYQSVVAANTDWNYFKVTQGNSN